MLRRYALGFSNAGRQISTINSNTPLEDTIRAKIRAAFDPQTLEIYNDSHLHVGHKAMQGNKSGETHFRLVITSDVFKSKLLPARHRMVYALLHDELSSEPGIHSLQLRTLTPEEETRLKEKKAEAQRKQIETQQTAPSSNQG